MKIKHNKKRNTYFLYEALIRELTKSIMESQEEKKQKILEILRTFFSDETVLGKQRHLVKEILTLNGEKREIVEKVIEEVKRVYFSFDQKNVFDEQTKVINKINKEVSRSTFQNFVPNYRYLATIDKIMSPSRS